jgi:hypothetical protein
MNREISPPRTAPVFPYVDFYSDCYMRSVASVLKSYQYENLAMVFGDSYGFFMKDSTDTKQVRVLSRIQGFESAFEEANISRENFNCDNLDIAYRDISERLKANVPILCYVDTYFIPHSPFFTSKHALHILVADQISNSGEEIHVVDSIANVNKEIKTEILLQSMQISDKVKHLLGKKGINWQLVYPKNQRLKFPISEKIHDSISCFDGSAKLSDILKQKILLEIGDASFIFGWQAIQGFSLDIINILQTMEEGNSVLGSPFIDVRWLAYRSKWFSRLMASDESNISKMLFSVMDSISQKWMIFHNIMIKYQIKRNTVALEHLQSLGIQLAEDHKEIYKRYFQALNKGENN